MIKLLKLSTVVYILTLIFLSPVYGSENERDKIIQEIIYNSISSYDGKCACPYQGTSNGSRCGKRSAYSKPGGYEPLCFPKDITEDIVNAFINSSKTEKNSAAKILGRVSITDGDTIKLGTIKVRLHGIDAPESRQNCIDAKNKAYACGRQSTAFLKSLVKNKEVKCEGKDKDRYGRIIGICYADEINLNSTMVKEGWAIAYRYYSKDYVKEEETAKRDKKGIWQGSFEEPYIWRKNN